jgi:hypothetical protein
LPTPTRSLAIVVLSLVSIARADSASLADSQEGLQVQSQAGTHAALTSHQSKHFVLLHAAGDAWASHAGRLLEETHDRFYRQFEQAGFKLAPIQHRLTWVCLNSRSSFDTYTRSADGMSLAWLDGYYSARTNRVALLLDHTEAAPPDERPPATLTANIAAVDSHSGYAGTGFADVARAMHEAAHQLAFNSGLQKRGVMYPIWASEGLASQFEYEHGNTVRQRRLVRMADHDRLIPMSELITCTRRPLDRRYSTNDLYAQSWGFFRFLLAEKPAALRGYMTCLSQQSPGPRDQAALRGEFIRFFGDLDDLEVEWKLFIRQLGQSEQTLASRN